MSVFKKWNLKLYDLTNDMIHTAIEAEIEVEYEDEEKKCWTVKGQFKMPYSWNSNKESLEYNNLFSFSVNWEMETVVNFEGEDRSLDGYYQFGGIYDLTYMADALQFIPWLQQQFIGKSETYTYEEDQQYVKEFPLYSKYYKLLEEIV